MSLKIDAPRKPDTSNQRVVAEAARGLVAEVQELLFSLENASGGTVKRVFERLRDLCEAIHVEDVPVPKRVVMAMGQALEKKVNQLVREAGDDPQVLENTRHVLLDAMRLLHGGRPLSDEEINTEHDALLRKYQVRTLGDCSVEFTLKAGMSRLDLIKEVNLWALAAIGQAGMYARTLRQWSNNESFTTPVSMDTVVRVECMPNSGNLTDEQQKAGGWNNVKLADLAAAHQAFLVFTGGEDMFGRLTVRALEGALLFNMYGLREERTSRRACAEHIIASRVPPAAAPKK